MRVSHSSDVVPDLESCKCKKRLLKKGVSDDRARKREKSAVPC
jgi:hypothetical protein